MAKASQMRPLDQLESIQEIDEALSDSVSFLSDSQRTTTDTSTTWGPGTLSGRALLALGEATIRGIDALLIGRRLTTIRLRAPSLTGSMYKDLLELCRPAMYSVWIAKQALRLTLAQICAGPESSVYMFVVFLCKWAEPEARLILLELVRSLPGLSHPPGWKLERLYDLMTAVIQVKDGRRSFIVEAAVLLDNTFPSATILPIDLLSAEATVEDLFRVRLSPETSSDPPTLSNATILMIFGRICNGSDNERIRCGLCVRELFGDQVQVFLQQLLSNELLLIHRAIADNPLAHKNICEFLATIFQITGDYCSRDVATKILTLLGKDHLWPVIRIATEIVEQKEISPLSKLQTTGRSWDSVRIRTWRAFQWIGPSHENGLTPKSRMLQIEHILSTKSNVLDHHFFDAVADASIFTRDFFTPELRSSAFECLFKYCLTSPWEKPLRYYPCFYHELVLRDMELHFQLPMGIAGFVLVSDVAESPLSMLQAIHSSQIRLEMWLSLYNCGMSSQARSRMLQIEEILTQTLNPDFSTQMPTTSELFGALVDIVIFSTDIFRSDLQSCAIKCLFDYWIFCSKSKQWEILHQVFSLFDSSLIQMQIFTTWRDRLPLAMLEDFIQTYSNDSTHPSDLIFLLSGWISGSHAFPGIFSDGQRGMSSF
ncbi:hypothetical protein MVEN_00365900 [Mycena venus]|uniref:Uncharacterized protein n=1 Tax=Mycena venus TaxID=2733690 RepID=A0A8H6YUC7_9AGAR|nr:hypothetical protein MVEN_00365900 [Mycena venus]